MKITLDLNGPFFNVAPMRGDIVIFKDSYITYIVLVDQIINNSIHGQFYFYNYKTRKLSNLYKTPHVNCGFYLNDIAGTIPHEFFNS